jgi:glutaredoxin 3
MAEKKKVRIYSTPYCPWCTKAKDFIKDHGVEVEEIDVSQDQEAAMYMVEKSGQNGVPVIEIGDEFVVGFDRERIIKLLGIED